MPIGINVTIAVATGETQQDAIDRIKAAWNIMDCDNPQDISDFHEANFGKFDQSRTLSHRFKYTLKAEQDRAPKPIVPFKRLSAPDPIRWVLKGYPAPDFASGTFKRMARPPKPKISGWAELNKVFRPRFRAKRRTNSKTIAGAIASLQAETIISSMPYKQLLTSAEEKNALEDGRIYVQPPKNNATVMPWPDMTEANAPPAIRFARTLCSLLAKDKMPFYPAEYHGHAVMIEHFLIGKLEDLQTDILAVAAAKAAELCALEIRQSGEWFEVYEIDHEREHHNVS